MTALHNHFFFDRPSVYFMHVGGEGTTLELATAGRKVLEAIRTVRRRGNKPGIRFAGRIPASRNRIDGPAVSSVLGVEGVAKDGMFKVVIGRETTAACGCAVGKTMGVNT